MILEEAKEFLLGCTESNARIERACSNRFVYANGIEWDDPVYLEALEQLLREGQIVQIPTPGQARTTVSYRRVSDEEASYFHHTMWPLTV